MSAKADLTASLAFVALMGSPLLSLAQPCSPGAIDAGVLLSGPGAADFGEIPEACLQSGLDLRLRTGLLIDEPDYYGALAVGGMLRARYPFGEHWAASAALDAATWRLAVNANVDSAAIGVGPATLGLQHLTLWDRLAIAWYGRLLLPLDTARRHGRLWGGELGFSGQARILSRLAFQGGIGVPVTLVAIDQIGRLSVLPITVGEAVVSPLPWVAFALGAALRTSLYSSRELHAFAGRAAVRFVAAGRWQFALGSEVPLAGQDRTDLVVSAFFGWALPDRTRDYVTFASSPVP